MSAEGHFCWEDCDEGPHGCICDNDCEPPDQTVDELDRLRRWKAEAMAVHAEWEETWIAAGRPGRPGASKALGVRDEIERLRGGTEWEYAVRNLSTGEVFEPVNGKWWRTTDNEEPVRRRAAGSWEPVEGETDE